MRLHVRLLKHLLGPLRQATGARCVVDHAPREARHAAAEPINKIPHELLEVELRPKPRCRISTMDVVHGPRPHEVCEILSNLRPLRGAKAHGRPEGHTTGLLQQRLQWLGAGHAQIQEDLHHERHGILPSQGVAGHDEVPGAGRPGSCQLIPQRVPQVDPQLRNGMVSTVVHEGGAVAEGSVDGSEIRAHRSVGHKVREERRTLEDHE
mmetsp:Transcript_80751/g.180669  ORF Transcript_80751/g.180669 Transcript_80751/m.180669 type:complete len:208 (+) Transcript_80751:31-654(+)